METGAIIEGRYLVEEFLGEGGAGKVFICRDKNLTAKFAVKILHSTASEKRDGPISFRSKSHC